MRDDASLRRLEEMAIDVYVLRGARSFADDAVADPVASRETPQPRNRARTRVRVMLLAHEGARANAVLAGVERALAHAGIDAARASSVDARGIDGFAGLVVFGDALARQAGDALPASRRESMSWTALPAIDEIERGALGKRALWGELKRVIRAIEGTNPAAR